MSSVAIETGKLTRALWKIWAALVAAGIAVQAARLIAGRDHLLGLTQLFALNAERNFPTLFSVFLLALSSMLLLLLYRRARESSDLKSRYWLTLAIGFFYMVCDEFMGFHEHLIEAARHVMGTTQLGLFHFGWTAPALVVILVVGIAMAPLLASLPRKTALRFFASAAIYLGGAVGMEMLGGWYAEQAGDTRYESAGYALATIIEESMEMGGIILFIGALMDLLISGTNTPTLELHKTPARR